jgi:hypothetical protein
VRGAINERQPLAATPARDCVQAHAGAPKKHEHGCKEATAQRRVVVQLCAPRCPRRQHAIAAKPEAFKKKRVNMTDRAVTGPSS